MTAASTANSARARTWLRCHGNDTHDRAKPGQSYYASPTPVWPSTHDEDIAAPCLAV